MSQSVLESAFRLILPEICREPTDPYHKKPICISRTTKDQSKQAGLILTLASILATKPLLNETSTGGAAFAQSLATSLNPNEIRTDRVGNAYIKESSLFD